MCQLFFISVFSVLLASKFSLGNALANEPGGAQKPIERGTLLSKEDVKKAQDLGSLEKNAEAWNGKTVTLKGRVQKVCQSKGCWFQITDTSGSPTVRITSKGYLFFVPKDTAGFEAVVQGTFHVKKLSVSEAEHFAADEGLKVPQKVLPTFEYRLEAVGVRLSPIGS